MTDDRPQDFDASAEQFAAYMQAPWGVLRADLIERQLAPHLPDHPCAILDVGCGSGVMAARFARRGHEVTGVDFANDMLDQARRTIQQEGLDGRVVLQEGDVLTLGQQFAGASFDVVMCHCVVEYLDGLDPALAGIASVLRAGGLVSLLLSNPHARLLKTAVVDLDPDDALAGVERETHPNKIFATRTRIYRREQVLDGLAAAGLEPVETYGVRAFWDLLPRDDRSITPEFYASMLRLELAMTTTSPFRDIANYQHVVARRLDHA